MNHVSVRTRLGALAAAAVAIGLTALATSAGAAVPTNNVFPISGRTVAACTNSFGDPRDGGTRRHQGNDCFAPRGTPLLAVESGRDECPTGGKGGNGIQLYGNSGTRYYYAHLDRQLVCNQNVTRGQVIGTVGNTGNAINGPPHLHFEIHPGGGAAIDPYPYLSQWGAGPPAVVAKPTYWQGMAAATHGYGYWLLGRDGGVFSFGYAQFSGSMGGRHINKPTVDIAADPDGKGYWLVASDGGVFAFDAQFHGSMAGRHLNAPIVGIAPTRSGHGYWLVGSDGGIFAFGDARFSGSMAGRPHAPVVDMAADRDGRGYWLVASDGGVFSFDAPFYGSMAGRPHAPIVDIATDPDGAGYWLAGSDGGVFSFSAPFSGSMAGRPLVKPVITLATDPNRPGYWLLGGDGGVFAFDAPFLGRGNEGL
jgi:hypothetical protein